MIKKMSSVLFPNAGVVMDALAFSGTYFVFSKLIGHGENKHKRHNVALEKCQRARGEQNRNRMKQNHFISKKLCQKNEAYIDKQYTLTMLMKQWLTITEYFQNE